MENKIQVFNFNGSDVREITDDEGNPWFVAKDVCKILNLKARDSVRYLDDDEKSNVPSKHIGQNGGKDPIIINESGLYSLVLNSRKPEAKLFKKWVTSEVLPEIRKTGSYSVKTNLEKEVTILQALTFQQEKIKELTIKAIVADELVNTDGLYLLSTVGKIIAGEPNIFCQWLVDNKYMYRKGDHKTLVPKSPYDKRAKGYFRVKLRITDDKSVEQTYFTPRGVCWIQALYLKKNGMLQLDYSKYLEA